MPYQRSIDRTRSKRRIRLLIGFSAIIMLLFTTMVVYQSRQAYLQALKSGEDDARRLTRILSEHVELTFLGADLALRRAIERQYMNSMFGGTIPQYMEQNFRMWLNETPQIAAMALVDAHGTVAAAAQKPGYERWLDYLKSAQGAKLFGYMRDTDDGVVFVGRQSTKDSPPLILMSRRYSLLNGEFGGIVLTAIDPEYFIHFYQAAAFGTVKFMALTLGDGTALAEGPASSGATDAVVRRLAMERRSALPAEMVEGTYTHTYTTAEGLHIAAGRLLQNMPVLVTVILSEHDVLTGWRQFRARDAGF
ncbi:MAG: hypothetical protein JO089_01805, partial [Alphaproteobacteria bacterium]|nr:hypothetical protein [Alphaproteobacteria bacterium]